MMTYVQFASFVNASASSTCARGSTESSKVYPNYLPIDRAHFQVRRRQMHMVTIGISFKASPTGFPKSFLLVYCDAGVETAPARVPHPHPDPTRCYSPHLSSARVLDCRCGPLLGQAACETQKIPFQIELGRSILLRSAKISRLRASRKRLSKKVSKKACRSTTLGPSDRRRIIRQIWYFFLHTALMKWCVTTRLSYSKDPFAIGLPDVTTETESKHRHAREIESGGRLGGVTFEPSNFE